MTEPNHDPAVSGETRRLRSAAENYQRMSQWLAGSFGAVAVALVAGLSLSNLGELSILRLALSIGGVLVALSSTVLIIHRTALVIPIEFLTFEQVDVVAGLDDRASQQLREAITTADGLFHSSLANYRKPNELRYRIKSLEQKLQTLAEGTEEALEVEQDLDIALEAGQNVVMFSNHFNARRAYERLRIAALVGSVVFVAGASLFAWASNPVSTSPDKMIVVLETDP